MRTAIAFTLLLSCINRVSAHDEETESADPYIWGTILVVLTFVAIMTYYILGPLRKQLNEINSQYHEELIDSEKFT